MKPILKIKSLEDAGGSCNYCDKGTLKKTGIGLQYPYDKVAVIKGKSVETRVCEDCLKEINSFKFE